MSEDQSPYDHGDGEVKTSCGSVFEDLGVECFDAKEFVAGFDRQYGNTVPIHPRHEIILQAALDWAKALREENAKLKRSALVEAAVEQSAEIIRLRNQVEKLREAIKPFAKIEPSMIGGKAMPHYWVSIGSPDKSSFTADDLRAARAAYEETGDGE